MKSILLIGCGGHAKSVVEIIESTNDWCVAGFVGLASQIGQQVLGYNILGTDRDLASLRSSFSFALLAVGQIKSSDVRQKLAHTVSSHGFSFPVVVASTAVISRHAVIGAGTVVGHHAMVNAGASVGEHCIINTGSLVEHDSQISGFCHISTNVAINGNVSIGHSSFVGSCSMIREGLALPPHSLISAGSRVMGWPPKDKL